MNWDVNIYMNHNIYMAFYEADMDIVKQIECELISQRFNPSELKEAKEKLYKWYLEFGTDKEEKSEYWLKGELVQYPVCWHNQPIAMFSKQTPDYNLTNYQYIINLLHYPERKLERISNV